MSDLLIISSSAPYVSNRANDALDAALAASNVGLRVTMLFEGSGIYQLQIGQIKDRSISQSIEKRIKSLPIFDIEDIYYYTTSPVASKLTLCDLAKPVNSDDRFNQIQNHAHILRF